MEYHRVRFLFISLMMIYASLLFERLTDNKAYSKKSSMLLKVNIYNWYLLILRN